MQQHGPDKRLINAFRGSSASRGLSDLKVQLALVQAACTMALEGTARATASQVAVRANTTYGTEAAASFAGQVFATLNINTVITRGKSRLVLD